MNNKLYWIWFALKDSITPKVKKELLDRYKTAGEIYFTEDYGSEAKEELIKILGDKSLDKAEEVYNRIERMGGYVVTIEDEEYPPLLKNLHHPPYVLYMLGEKMKWNELLTVAVVGTRKCSRYGKRATETIASALAESGAVVVSGMARGIDSAAARAALKSGGKTVAVLGSGLDVIYPAENKDLYKEISQNGVVITEYPPGTRPLRENFPRRNRIMAGLSYGVLVSQAPEKSGALITAAYAIENGRDVFAIPSDIFEIGFEGSNELIRQGAKLVTCAEDIIGEYPYIKLNRAEPAAKGGLENIDMQELTEEEKELVVLLADGQMHVDNIARCLGKTSSEINTLLMMLEINGTVKKDTGNIYYL